MQPSQVSAIALGNWNPKIFTPVWVKERLLCLNSEDEIKVQLDFNDMDFGLQYKNLILIPKGTVLEIRTKSFEQADLQIFTKALMGIFDLLPQTPIKAIGINIIYNFSKDADNRYFTLLEKFVHFKGFEVTMARYSLKKDKYLANIIIEKKGLETVSVNFNFHYSRTIDLEKTFLETHILESSKILSDGI